jgi:hypothetical protein
LRGWMCQCGEQLSFVGERAICQSCGDAYQRQGQIVSLERGE